VEKEERGTFRKVQRDTIHAGGEGNHLAKAAVGFETEKLGPIGSL
jgi:hypothetical protein